MAVLSELRYPTTRIAKVFSGFLALLLFAVVSVSTISGFLLYQTLRPARNAASFDLSVMMGHPDHVFVSDPGRRSARRLALSRPAWRAYCGRLPRISVPARGRAYAGDGATGSPVQRLPVRFRGPWHEHGRTRRSATGRRPNCKRRCRRSRRATTWTPSISDCGELIWEGTRR